MGVERRRRRREKGRRDSVEERTKRREQKPREREKKRADGVKADEYSNRDRFEGVAFFSRKVTYQKVNVQRIGQLFWSPRT